MVSCFAVLLLCLLVLPMAGITANGNGIGSATWEREHSRRSGWEWMGRDAFDEFIEEFDRLNADNCHEQLSTRMPLNTISQTISFNGILSV